MISGMSKISAFIAAGRLKEALRESNRILKEEKSLFWAWDAKAICYVRMHKLKAALKSFDKALAINPYDFFASSEKGKCLMLLGKWKEAKRALQRALELLSRIGNEKDGQAELLVALGITSVALGNAGANTYFQRARALAPQKAHELGQLLLNGLKS